MAPSTGAVVVHALAIASLFFRFLCNFTMFQRLSCLPCVSYSALASPKSALAFQSLPCLPCVSYSFLVTTMYLPYSLRLFAFHGTASSNADFSFQSKAGIHTGGEDLGYPPQIHSVLTLFGIITTKCITSWTNELCWQGYAYALKSAPELISEH